MRLCPRSNPCLRSRIAAGCVLAWALLAAGGCAGLSPADEQFAQQRLELRERQLNWTLDRARRAEARSAPNLRATRAKIDRAFRKDVETTAAMPQVLDRRVADEVARFRDRQRLYADTASRLFLPPMDQIVRTAIAMFY